MQRYEGFERWHATSATERSGRIAARVGRDLTAQWLDALYDSPVLFSGLLDAHGVVVDGNHLSIEGCGFERAEILGTPFWDCGWWSPDPELAERVRGWWQTAVATRRSLSSVSRYYRAGGQSGMVELGLVPIVDSGPDGGSVRYVVATGLDISELLAAQADREDRMTADAMSSRAAEQRFRAGLDAMIDNVTIAHAVRQDGAIVDFEIDFANQSSADGAGRSAAELVGRRVCELYPSWRSTGLFDLFAGVVETGVPFVGERLGYQDTLPDGTVISGHWDIQVSRLDDGYIAASRDVTEIVRIEAAARAAALSSARERFAIDLLQEAALNLDHPDVDGVDLGFHYQPAERDLPLGGDWYDAVALGDGRVVLIIADVAGHGPPAAALMVQLRNILRAVAVEHPEPDEVLRRANTIILALHGQTTPLTTCCVGVLCGATGTFDWALAGHLPPLLCRADGTTTFLELPPGPPLGTVADASYRPDRVAIAPGERIVLYTDGLVETRTTPIDTDLARLAAGALASRHLAPGDAAPWLAANICSGEDDTAIIVVDLRDRQDA